MTVLRWIVSVTLTVTVAAPSVANIPTDLPPKPQMTLPITGEAPLLIDADGYAVSLMDAETE